MGEAIWQDGDGCFWCRACLLVVSVQRYRKVSGANGDSGWTGDILLDC
jgi:hypothetical protein